MKSLHRIAMTQTTSFEAAFYGLKVFLCSLLMAQKQNPHRTMQRSKLLDDGEEKDHTEKVRIKYSSHLEFIYHLFFFHIFLINVLGQE